MDAERRQRTGPTRSEPPQRGAAWQGRAGRAPARVAVALVLAVGCFKQPPAEERAPAAAPESAPPAAPLPAAPPIAPPVVPQPLPRAPAPSAASMEGRRATLTDESAPAERDGSGGAAPKRASVPRAPQTSAAQGRAAERTESSAEAEGPIGGALGAETKPDPRAPARLRQRLDRAYRASTPDCPSARERKKAVCDLASQICQLIDRDPNVASVAEYCAEAKERCTAAERRTAERCAE